jgi:hypothetical protein
MNEARDADSAKLNRTTTLSRLERERQRNLRFQPHLHRRLPRRGTRLSKLLVLSSLPELAQPTLIVLLGAVASSLESARALWFHRSETDVDSDRRSPITMPQRHFRGRELEGGVLLECEEWQDE